MSNIGREDCSKLRKKFYFSVIRRLDPFPRVFRQLKECLTLQLHEMIRVLHEVACPIVCVLCCDRYWQIGLLKLMKNYHIFIFSRFCPFPQVLGQVNEWPILQLHAMIRLLHAVACPILFILFYEQDWQGGVFKVMKNDYFFVLLVVWAFSPKFLCMLISSLYQNCLKL